MNQAAVNPGETTAGLIPTSAGQLRAIAQLRWRLTVNSLRSVRGQLNLLSRVLGGFMVLSVGGGGATAMFFIGLWATTKDPGWLALPFWIIFLFWQVFPVLATAFAQNLDSVLPIAFSHAVLRLFSGASGLRHLGYCHRVGIFLARRTISGDHFG